MSIDSTNIANSYANYEGGSIYIDNDGTNMTITNTNIFSSAVSKDSTSLGSSGGFMLIKAGRVFNMFNS